MGLLCSLLACMQIAGKVRESNGDAAITIVHAGAALCDAYLPGADPKALAGFQQRLLTVCHAAKISVRLGARVTNIGPSDCPSGFKVNPGRVHVSRGASVTADLVLWCTGTASNAPKVLAADYLDAKGLVKVDRHLCIEGVPDHSAFAIGDCTCLEEPKLSVNAGSRVGKGMGFPAGQPRPPRLPLPAQIDEHMKELVSQFSLHFKLN